MKKRLLLIFNCLLLCCTVSLAWILSGNPEIVDALQFDFTDSDKLVISSVNVDTTVVLLIDGQEVPLDEDFQLDPGMLVPDKMIPFRIKFNYQSADEEKTSLAIRLSLVGITASSEEFLQTVSISVTPVTDGLSAPNGPLTIYKSFGEATISGDGETYTLDIYGNENRLYIPHKEDGESVLDCYLMMSKDAGAEFQNMWLDIRAFRLE